METDRAGLQILTRAEALVLLATTDLGRIAISWRAMPMILPVHFTLDDGCIIVATWDGSILSKATRHTVVAFEADGPSPLGHPAWSVLVNGIADHVADAGLTRRSTRWVLDRPAHLLSISTEHVSGRRAPAHWEDVRPWPTGADRCTLEP